MYLKFRFFGIVLVVVVIFMGLSGCDFEFFVRIISLMIDSIIVVIVNGELIFIVDVEFEVVV